MNKQKQAEDTTNNVVKKEKVVITGDMNIADVVFKYPDVAEVMMDYGLHCFNCMANGLDTIEMGAQLHMMEEDEVKEMLERINEVVQHGE